MANNFFKNGDKAYSENLNDSILVGNAFNWTVNVALPTDTGAVFPNSSTVVKGKVADLSITPNSNLSIGSTISNSSGSNQVYRLTVYPNFNRFGGFKSISLTADSGVTFYIANKGGTSPIANNLDYDDLGNVPELKVLKEYDIVITIPPSEGVEELSFVLQSRGADVNASISQDNVIGTVDLIYPVGSIYMSVNNTNPSVLFGGTWEQLKDKFLLSAGDTYTNGSTGGSADAVVVSHTHTQNAHSHTLDNSKKYVVASNNAYAEGVKRLATRDNDDGGYYLRSDYASSITVYTNTANATATNQTTGESGTGKNMPPYLVVYMWKRTA